MDMASGAGVFSRAPDGMINLKDIEGEEAAWKCHVFPRYFSRPEPFGVRWVFPLAVRDPFLDDAKEAGTSGWLKTR
jgi:hypothetical protein